ncbi:hypothetical protein K437DRAFT_170107 [Tilletiaria anomala UBC 951]|uniref:Nucleoside diphosphate kinase n=1 Tax=Tilletiaria anomala (strain ATCC 24038 / CBS 436.72 / UBC 951) TaxID=1037660 RepID=A0A066VT68_TILAU|nr:uncharacterized protein K437DRAFT_170107 [Tilletiaria anomala UBC 951]KDN41770.1 hypothetical protein K437DRAFT_170107 [Tilletiaria anomala UBC 951]
MDNLEGASPQYIRLSRTIAILAKSAAQVHRLAIIRCIQEAGFSILEERMEEWRHPDDEDFLSEFLACEADERKWVNRLTGCPIYVMVLERKSAPAMWLDMIGLGQREQVGAMDARDSVTPRSDGLRAMYGTECFYGSPSLVGAERQIAICFPELSDGYVVADPFAPSDTVLVQANDVLYDEDGRAFDANNGEELDLQEEISLPQIENSMYRSGSGSQGTNSAGISPPKVFRARPIPSSVAKPSIQPRMSRAAALRMGIELPAVPRRDASSSSTSSSLGPVGISGFPRADVASPKSLVKPTVAPRMNKAVAARLGALAGGAEATAYSTPPPVSARERVAVDFSSTPGHKRASSGIKLASLQTPTITPRTNKAAAARLSGSTPSVSTPTGGNSVKSTPPSAFSPLPRTGSMNRTVSSSQCSAGPRERREVDFSNTPGHKRTVSAAARPASLRAPSIEPRLNKAAAARTGRPQSSAGLPAGRDGANGNVKENASPARNSTSMRGRVVDFSNTLGHRRSSISNMPPLASLKAPSIAPWSNAAAAVRARPPSRSSSALGHHARQQQRSGSTLGFASSGGPAAMRTGGSSIDAATSAAVNRSIRSKFPPSSYRHSMMSFPSQPVSRG